VPYPLRIIESPPENPEPPETDIAPPTFIDNAVETEPAKISTIDPEEEAEYPVEIFTDPAGPEALDPVCNDRLPDGVTEDCPEYMDISPSPSRPDATFTFPPLPAAIATVPPFPNLLSPESSCKDPAVFPEPEDTNIDPALLCSEKPDKILTSPEAQLELPVDNLIRPDEVFAFEIKPNDIIDTDPLDPDTLGPLNKDTDPPGPVDD